MIGMKGTTPLTQLSQSFRDRLRTVDPELKDESYAGESYDAVVISALAAQIAKSTDPRAIAAQINGVTVGGQACDSPATCLPLVKAGANIRYTGITLRLGGFTDAGEPSAIDVRHSPLRGRQPAGHHPDPVRRHRKREQRDREHAAGIRGCRHRPIAHRRAAAAHR